MKVKCDFVRQAQEKGQRWLREQLGQRHRVTIEYGVFKDILVSVKCHDLPNFSYRIIHSIFRCRIKLSLPIKEAVTMIFLCVVKSTGLNDGLDIRSEAHKG